jgi:hypothetical protein
MSKCLKLSETRELANFVGKNWDTKKWHMCQFFCDVLVFMAWFFSFSEKGNKIMTKPKN